VLLHLDPDTTSPDTLRAASAVAAALPPSLRAKVDDVSAATPDSVRLDLTGGGLVRWGDAQDSATKAKVLAVLLSHHAHVYDVTAPGFATTS
jgi:cell division protein FtsQ